MEITINFNDSNYTFRPWCSSDGKVFSQNFAFDSETQLIDEKQPWITPAYVLGAVYDGNQGFFLTRDTTGDFFQAHKDVPVIMHHAPFDLDVLNLLCPSLQIYDWVEESLVWDTELLHRLYCLGTEGHTARGKGQATLEACAKRYLGIELPKDVKDTDDNLVRLNYGKWLQQPLEKFEPVYLDYLAKDALVTYQIFDSLQDKLADLIVANENAYGNAPVLKNNIVKYGFQTHHIQLRGAIVLPKITANGLRVDPTNRDELKACLEADVKETDIKLFEHGYSSGEGSGKALQKIMAEIERDHPGLILPKTAKGKYATSKESLNSLEIDHPFLNNYQKSKAIKKLLSTYLQKMDKPRLHPSFDVLMTSGRTSSYGDINAQNLPRDDRIRACFIPSEGHVFIAADYATLEMATLAQCVMAIYGGNSAMADMINKGQDLHRAVAAKVTGKPEDKITKEERQKAKAINFGKPGGMGDEGLKQYAKATFGIEMSEADVGEFTAKWFELFPEMQRFLENPSNPGLLAAEFFDLNWDDYHAALDHTVMQGLTTESLDILGWMCLKVLAEAEPISNGDKAYASAGIEYFWARVQARLGDIPADLQEDIRERNVSPDLRKKVIRFLESAPVWTLTGRVRANASYTQQHNTVFQGLAADGTKLALWKLWRAGYRIVNFLHDEFLIEVPENEDLSKHAEQIRQLMIEAMQEVVPEVRIEVQYAAMKRWYKNAEAVYDPDGRLMPWGPATVPPIKAQELVESNNSMMIPAVPGVTDIALIDSTNRSTETVRDIEVTNVKKLGFDNPSRDLKAKHRSGYDPQLKSETSIVAKTSNGKNESITDSHNVAINKDIKKALVEALKQCADEIQGNISDNLENRDLFLLDSEGEIESPQCTDLQINSVLITTAVENHFQALLDCVIEVEAEATYEDPEEFFYDSEDKTAFYTEKHGMAKAVSYENIEVSGTYESSEPSNITIGAIKVLDQELEFEIDPYSDSIAYDDL